MSSLGGDVADGHLKRTPQSVYYIRAVCRLKDAYLASERYKVMFAQAVDINVSNNDHLFVVFRENGFTDDL